jgi:hypothetical protein
MRSSRPGQVLLVLAALVLLSCPVFAQLGSTVPNWTVPQSGSSSGSTHRGMTTQTDIGFGGTAMIPVVPCRIVDTRGAAGTYGGPALSAGVARAFALPGGPCTGLPGSVNAWSLNITVVSPAAAGFIKAYPTGGSAPVVSTLNYTAGVTLANAAIVPSGPSGSITVASSAGTHLLIDVNGYFVGNGSLNPLNPGEYVGWQGNYGGGMVFGWNTSATGSGMFGRADGTTAGAAGVIGQAVGTGANVFGVKGITASQSLDSAGVKGVGGYGDPFGDTGDCGPCFSAGVRGVNNASGASTAIGVIGISRSRGVVGTVLNDTTGTGSVATGFLAANFGGTFYGVYSSGDFGGSGAKFFVEPDRVDPARVIRYIALEGPEAGTYFRGTSRTAGREAIIEVPDSFREVTEEEGVTVQLTPVGELATIAVISQDLHRIVVRSSKDVTFHYMVNGVRQGYRNFQPVLESPQFMPDRPEAKMPDYLNEAQKRKLIENGTYREDGTVNMDTAERQGWTRVWSGAGSTPQIAPNPSSPTHD